MSRQQLIVRQEEQQLNISEILRTYGKQFKQITERYSDRRSGRCALGVLMSYYGWNGKEDSHAATKLMAVSIALRHIGVSCELVVRLNDAGMTFVEIADYLVEAYEPTNKE
jgi:hypothetical protein